MISDSRTGLTLRGEDDGARCRLRVLLPYVHGELELAAVEAEEATPFSGRAEQRLWQRLRLQGKAAPIVCSLAVGSRGM